MTTVSIIVPVFNTPEKFLRECLNSLLEQTLENYEIIVVNDASTRNTLEILEEYRENNPERIVVIDSKINLKQGGARNLGLKVARGEYLAFIDSDDIAKPSMYETLYKKAKDENADAVLCKLERFSNTGQVLGESMIPDAWKMEFVLPDRIQELFLNSGSVCCKLYRSSIIQDNRVLFPEKMFYEDNAWCPLCMLYLKKIAFVDECLYQYRLNENSTTESKDINKYLQRCKAAEWLEHELTSRGLLERVKEAAEFWFFHCYYASTVKMCIIGFERLYYKELCVIRNKMRSKERKFWTNKYYRNNIRRYEAEERLYMRLVMLSPVLGVIIVKTINFLRVIKHRIGV